MGRLRVAASAALAALLLSGCGKPEPIRIGFLGELTGRSADLGEAARNGMTLALEEIRAKRILGDRTVELVIRDTGGDAQSAAAAAAALVAERVEAIVGPTTSAMVDAVLPVTEQAGTLVLSPTASAVKFHGKDDLLFRINWTTRDNGNFYARYSLDKGYRRIAAAANAENRSFSESWLKEFRAAFEQGGGRIVAEQFFGSAEGGHGAVVEALLEASPDALLFIANAADAARLAQQARKRRHDLPLIAAEWAGTDQLIELGGRAVEGMMLVQAYDRDDNSARFRAFHDTYVKRFGRAPVFASILSYDASMALLQGLSRRPKGMSLKEAMIRLGPFDGLQQQIRFDAYGDTQRTAYYVVIMDGRYVKEP